MRQRNPRNNVFLAPHGNIEENNPEPPLAAQYFQSSFYRSRFVQFLSVFHLLDEVFGGSLLGISRGLDYLYLFILICHIQMYPVRNKPQDHHIIHNQMRTDGFEMLTSAVDFHFLNASKKITVSSR